MFEIVSICKGGGYRYCRTNPPHPKRNSKGLYPLHRVLMENKLKRFLEANEEVHHRDEDKRNDDPENLIVLTKSQHSKEHHPVMDDVVLNCKCGKSFSIKPHRLRVRLKANKTGNVCCSRQCAALFSHQPTKGELCLQPCQ